MPKAFKTPRDKYSSPKLASSRFNRTGGATLVGGVYFVDVAQVQAESQVAPVAGNSSDNITGVTTALISQGGLPLVVAQAVAADNAKVLTAEGEGIILNVLVETTVADVVAGDKLKVVNGQAYMIKATVGTDRWNAIAMGGQTTNGATIMQVLFFSIGKF